ncbi:MAG: DUF1428 domain-containing protein [Deltaproteobacteria bacterium]|nr:DUF1428 domain-containing protein [Deltaproteobacteria bacterium]
MASYVDGFVIPIPKKNLRAYRRMARLGAKVWMEYGALAFYECVGDDLSVRWGTGFGRLARLKPGETAVFSWIVYKSRADRDRVNAKVMKDPRMSDPKMQKTMPFDPRRMAYGGFKVLVQGHEG